jgi:hypothetical protein
MNFGVSDVLNFDKNYRHSLSVRVRNKKNALAD